MSYLLSMDYCGGFFSMFRASPYQRRTAIRDFISNFVCTLNKLQIEAAYPIAECVLKRMLDYNLAYHTPVHILSMLQTVNKLDIKLAWWEEMALWFHDAIYIPGAESGANEEASATFMEAMLRPYINNTKLTTIRMAILSTAYHLADIKVIPRQHDVLMDLDLCCFSFPSPGCDMANYLVCREYLPVYNDDHTKVVTARKNFLVKLLSRGHGGVYRSKPFQRLEIRAREVIVSILQRI